MAAGVSFQAKCDLGTFKETAARELGEEAGLTGEFTFYYEILEMVYAKTTGEQLEDKFFHIVEANNLIGKFQKNNKEGKNMFVTKQEFRKLDPKFHNEQDLLDWFLTKNFSFKEVEYFIERF